MSVNMCDANGNLTRVDGVAGYEKSNDFSMESGVTKIQAEARKIDKISWLYAVVQKNLVLNQWNDLFTLPSGFYDSDTKDLVMINTSNDIALHGKVSNGKVSVYPVASTASAMATNIAINYVEILQ